MVAGGNKSGTVENVAFYLISDDPKMSPEAEMKKEEVEDVKELPASVTFKDLAKRHWALALKVLELLICATSMGFIYEPAATTELGKGYGNTQFMHHIGIVYTTYTGFMVINCILIISRILKQRVPYVTVTLFSVAGAGLSMITCILLFIDRLYLIRYYHFSPHMHWLVMMTTALGFTLVNVFVFGVDAVFTSIKKEDF